jgi:hypothetical protein
MVLRRASSTGGGDSVMTASVTVVPRRVGKGFLKEDARNDLRAVRNALYDFLDGVPARSSCPWHTGAAPKTSLEQQLADRVRLQM